MPTGSPTSTPMATMARDMTTTEMAVCRRVKPIDRSTARSRRRRRTATTSALASASTAIDPTIAATPAGSPPELLEVLDRHRDRLRVGFEPRRQELGELADVLRRARPPRPRR